MILEQTEKTRAKKLFQMQFIADTQTHNTDGFLGYSFMDSLPQMPGSKHTHIHAHILSLFHLDLYLLCITGLMRWNFLSLCLSLWWSSPWLSPPRTSVSNILAPLSALPPLLVFFSFIHNHSHCHSCSPCRPFFCSGFHLLRVSLPPSLSVYQIADVTFSISH